MSSVRKTYALQVILEYFDQREKLAIQGANKHIYNRVLVKIVPEIKLGSMDKWYYIQSG